MKTIRIPQGNEFSLFVPLVLKDGTAVEGERLSDIQVLLQSSPPRQSYAVSVNVQSNYVVVTPQVELPLGSYDLTITARYENRDIAILLNNCFSISTWTNGSDYEKYLVDKEIVLEQQVLIGAFNTDAELETLKEQYRTAIAAAQAAQAEAEAAKEAFDEKAEQLEDVAKESTLLQKSAAIIEAISGIHIDIPDNIATKDDVTAAKQAILDALSQIQPEDPNSKALAEFFGVTLLQGYEFMQDTEVTDELEDIMQALDPELTAEQAATITAEAMNIINPSQS